MPHCLVSPGDDILQNYSEYKQVPDTESQDTEHSHHHKGSSCCLSLTSTLNPGNH